jgi:ATP/maltotriose-dependent transcriptional regulator MalT
MSATGHLARGRQAFARRAWAEAYDGLTSADGKASLAVVDLELTARAAYLLGRDEDCRAFLVRAHQAHVSARDCPGAARCAFWLAFSLMGRGEHAQAGGWIARAQRLLEEHPDDCVERGYLQLPKALQLSGQQRYDEAIAVFQAAAAVGDRFADADLTGLARQGQGRALIRLGRTAEGVALLDEVMVGVLAGEMSPIAAGTIYCSVIEACHEMFDLGRAREWTGALGDFCAAQPDLVPYRGQCLVRRAEIMELRGDWREAADEAERACTLLEQQAGEPAAGAAFYQLGELYRLRGDAARAEASYRRAAESGRRPEPGLALLRLAAGDTAAARAAIDRALAERHTPRIRIQLLAAAVEISLAAGDPEAARAAVAELDGVAIHLQTPALLRAITGHARGAIQLAEGDTRNALTSLRETFAVWSALDAPYRAARCRVLIAQACRALGDHEAARFEFDAALTTFDRLGAAPDATGVRGLCTAPAAALETTLTARELEVLRLVATGRTNRAIADALAISEKTVARHLSNIFTKLDLPSRAAATAYAYRHDLIS